MSSCCRGRTCEQVFGSRAAERSLRRYLAHGVPAVEREILDVARRDGLDGARVLDLGGGIGALQAELLLAGAARGETIEIVPAYAPFARELATTKGIDDRSRFRVLDVLAHPDLVAPADVVLLNKVICCSPDGLDLTALAARLTRATLLISFPRDVFWVRASIAAQNAIHRILRHDYRAFVRPFAEIVRAATSTGLRLVERRRTAAWELIALSR